MEFTIKAKAPEKLANALVIVGVPSDGDLAGVAAALDVASTGAIEAVRKDGELDGIGSTALLRALPGTKLKRLLLVSFGKSAEASERNWRKGLEAVARAVRNAGVKDVAVCLADVTPEGRDLVWATTQATRTIADLCYVYEHDMAPKASAEALKKRPTKVVMVVADDSDEALGKAVASGHAIAQGMALARDLGNRPGNHCTPSHLVDEAHALGKAYKLDVDVLDREAMEKLGMHSLLSVAAGSAQPPFCISMTYRGGKAKDAPVVLVGKGITFDTGGISLKPSPEMDEMKYDMCGAASVFGTLKAVAEMKLPINVVGIVPTTENMPGGRATKPGDVVRSMAGLTIEILNTDAEGRLILCDALTYAERFKPACVIDIATLTGACIVALGKIPSGLLANDEALAAELTACGTDTGDRVWQLPLWDDYQDLLKSNFADIANIGGGRYGGTITAACFLSRFTKDYRWAHLDIAGTAWVSGDAKGATGRPVPLLTEFLMRRAAG